MYSIVIPSRCGFFNTILSPAEQICQNSSQAEQERKQTTWAFAIIKTPEASSPILRLGLPSANPRTSRCRKHAPFLRSAPWIVNSLSSLSACSSSSQRRAEKRDCMLNGDSTWANRHSRRKLWYFSWPLEANCIFFFFPLNTKDEVRDRIAALNANLNKIMLIS